MPPLRQGRSRPHPLQRTTGQPVASKAGAGGEREVIQRALADPRAASAKDLRIMQRAAGNRAVSRWVTPATGRAAGTIQRKGGLAKFSAGQWSDYKQDMGTYGGMLKEGFVDNPLSAYNYFAPSEEDKQKKGIGQSIKRGGQHLLGGLAAGVTGLYSGALSLGLAGAGAIASTVGRGLAVAGRGLWSGLTGTPGKMRALGGAISNKWALMTGKKGEGFSAQAATSRMDIGHTAASVLNGTVSQTVGAAVEAGTVGAQVLAAVTGPISTVLGFIKGAVSSARAHRARKRENVAEQAAEEASQVDFVQKQLEVWQAKQDRVSEEESANKKQELEDDNKLFLEAVRYLGGKNKAKKWRSILEATGAFTGAIGSAALTGGMIAGAVGLVALLASNPVGWGIALGLVGAGLLTAIGFALFKVGKSIYKGKEKGVNREKYADAFYRLVQKGYPPAIEFLKEIGVLKKDEEEKAGKFTLASFLADKVQATAYLKGKMRST